jgi:hypothetical protein
MAFMFENLQVYQKAVGLADRVAGLTKGFPRGYFFLADRLNGPALSIAANVAEGNGRFNQAGPQKLLRHRSRQRPGMRTSAGTRRPAGPAGATPARTDEG